MKFTDAQLASIKAWTLKKLENISDADSGVLGDYVLALLSTDGTNEAVRKHAKGELEDFLNEHTDTFLNDLFDKVAPLQSASPEYFPPPAIPSIPAGTRPSRTQRPARHPFVTTRGHSASATKSRKRSYQEANETEQDGIHNVNWKSERGTFRSGRGGRRNGGHQLSTSFRPQPGTMIMGFPQPPIHPPGLPMVDPNNPMASFEVMKAMIPFMAQITGEGQCMPMPLELVNKQKCHDYNTKGFCVRGRTCPYEHRFDHTTAGAGYNKYGADKAVVETNGFGSNHHPAPERRYFEQAKPKVSPQMVSGPGTQARRPSSRHLNHSSRTAIFVRAIPQENFDETQLRSFFVQFGTIAYIALKEHTLSAVIQFIDHSSAVKAIESPKPIFHNRFVQVNWYNASFSGKGNINGIAYITPFRRRLKDNQSYEAIGKLFEPEADSEVFEMRQAIKQKKHEERLAQLRKVNDTKADLLRRKDDFLKKYGEDKARLIIQAAENNSSTPDASGTPNKTQALREHLAKLEAEARKQGIDPDAMSMIDGSSNYSPSSLYSSFDGGRGKGRGFLRCSPSFRGRGGYSNSHATIPAPAVKRLDNRPKSLGISRNHAAFDDESLRIALLRIGEVENIQTFSQARGSALGSLVVTFRERWQAEKVMKKLQARDGIAGIGKVVVRWTNIDGNVASTSASTPKTEIEVESSGEDEGEIGDEEMVDLPADDQEEDMQREENLDVAGEDEWDLIT